MLNKYANVVIVSTLLYILLSSLAISPCYADSARFTAISAGYFHCLALKDDGTVWAWGGNMDGQLGDGTNQSRPYMVQVKGLTNIIAISAGGFHSLALKEDGTVWAWGDNSFYQLGDGTNVTRYTPVQVQGLTDITMISAGCSHNLALKNDGTVWVWGKNRFGELGDGTMEVRPTPVKLPITDVKSITAGYYASFFIKEDGTAWVCGDNVFVEYMESGICDYGRLGDPSEIKSINTPQMLDIDNVASVAPPVHNHFMILKNDGTVWVWGNGDNGQLGNGIKSDNPHNPVYQITPIQEKGLDNIKMVASGESHCIALKDDGTVWAWGDNTNGEVGDSASLRQLTPIKVDGLSNVISIATGGGFSLALKSDGTVWAWGSNTYCQMGNGNIGGSQHTPAQVLTTPVPTTPIVTIIAGPSGIATPLISPGQYNNTTQENSSMSLSPGLSSTQFIGVIGMMILAIMVLYLLYIRKK